MSTNSSVSTFTLDDKSYNISDLEEGYLDILIALTRSQSKIQELRSDIAIQTAGREALMKTMQEKVKTLTPVSVEA